MKKHSNTFEIMMLSAITIQLVSILSCRHELTIGGEIFIPIIVFFLFKIIKEIAEIFK